MLRQHHRTLCKRLNRQYQLTSSFTTAPSRADVVIIGGGAIGSSIADWLIRTDASLSVVCIERDPAFTMASSALSVGSIRQQFSLKENVEISQFGIDFIHELSSDDENSVQFDSGGYAFLSTTEPGATQLRENVRMQRECGAEVQLFGTGSEFKKHFPWCNVEDVTEATLGSPGEEGWFDPFTLTTALKRRAAGRGVTFVQGEVCNITCADTTGDQQKSIDVVQYRDSAGGVADSRKLALRHAH